jgi:hypothetical protein
LITASEEVIENVKEADKKFRRLQMLKELRIMYSLYTSIINALQVITTQDFEFLKDFINWWARNKETFDADKAEEEAKKKPKKPKDKKKGKKGGGPKVVRPG